jgi:glutaminyl-peptide cyclotransferase
MQRTVISILAIILAFCSCTPNQNASSDDSVLNGDKAMDHVRTQVAFGPRPPGSVALQKCRDYIRQTLQSFGYQIEDDAFTADTPYGPIQMHNLIARKGTGNKSVVAFATHYDTKLMEGENFVGANDAGSSTGLVLELARVLSERKDALDYWFVFLDGEEALIEWSTFDSTYGSRHLAGRWKKEGIAPKVRAFILLDMIGDRDLGILYDVNSTPWLMDLAWNTAKKTGQKNILSSERTAMSDDHIPFVDIGVPCVDIIDFNYGPSNSYWHTPADTLDKLSPQSMERVGKLVLAMLPALQKKQ